MHSFNRYLLKFFSTLDSVGRCKAKWDNLCQELTILKHSYAYTLATTFPTPSSLLTQIQALQSSQNSRGQCGEGRRRALWWEGWRGYYASSLFSSSPIRAAHSIPELPLYSHGFSHQPETLKTVSSDLSSPDSCIQLMLTFLPECPMGPSSSKSGKYCVLPPAPPQLVSVLAHSPAGAAPWIECPPHLNSWKHPPSLS